MARESGMIMNQRAAAFLFSFDPKQRVFVVDESRVFTLEKCLWMQRGRIFILFNLSSAKNRHGCFLC